MKAFTGFAIGTLAVLGAIAAVGIYLKKKTEKELDYDKFDDIMESDDDFDTFFDEDDEVIDDVAETADEAEKADEDAAVQVEDSPEATAE